MINPQTFLEGLPNFCVAYFESLLKIKSFPGAEEVYYLILELLFRQKIQAGQ